MFPTACFKWWYVTSQSKSNLCAYCQSGLELPGINYKFNGKKYRYFYGSRVEWSPQPNMVRLWYSTCFKNNKNAPIWKENVTFTCFCFSSLLCVVMLGTQIAKVDTVTRKHLFWTQDNCYPSEPVFVASPGAVEEDDGKVRLFVIVLV